MLTRRIFLERVGAAGGSAAVYRAMGALGLMAMPASGTASTGPFSLDGHSGAGVKVLILGAGLAGLCAAYELGKRGYDCQLLEARNRPGGRAHTIRRGTVEVEEGGARQECTFDDGFYINPGPARIPQHHVTLDYCRELGVAIEPFAQVNESAYLYHERGGALAGRKVRVREAKADLYGYTAELLAKAVSQPALDSALTAADKERLLDFLASDGNLGGDGKYHRGERGGYRIFPGAGDVAGEYPTSYKFADLLEAGFGRHFADDYELNWQMMMFQMVGGNDHLPRAFAAKLGDKIAYSAEVIELHQSDTGVRAVYRKDGKTNTATADYCICAIPLSVLKDIPADFAPPMMSAIRNTQYAPTGKIGLQFKRRFWEEDDRIFGGITRTDLPLTQIFYPSTGFLGRKGVLIGYYHFGFDAFAYGSLSPTDRARRALAEGAKIHPQYPAEFDNVSFSVAWHKVPFTKGGWAEHRAGSASYALLNKPDGRIHLAGEHLSYLPGWMAGALESARRVSTAVHERAVATVTRKD